MSRGAGTAGRDQSSDAKGGLMIEAATIDAIRPRNEETSAGSFGSSFG